MRGFFCPETMLQRQATPVHGDETGQRQRTVRGAVVRVGAAEAEGHCSQT